MRPSTVGIDPLHPARWFVTFQSGNRMTHSMSKSLDRRRCGSTACIGHWGGAPAEVRAARSRRRVPILVSHSLTPFYKPARAPTGVWGMGYRCEVVDGDADTIAVAPSSQVYEIAEVSQRLSLGIEAGGEISLLTGSRFPETWFEWRLVQGDDGSVGDGN